MGLSSPMVSGLLTAFAASYAAALPTFAPLLQRQASEVPAYVKNYAPLVWLHSTETYFPSDIASQLDHTQPEVNFAVVNGYPTPLTLNNLDALNSEGGKSIYLTSKDDVTTNPSWLNGAKPDGSGKTNGATSLAVIVNDRGNGRVDAFYMYFYAYNWGGRVLGQDVGDHVGDWEHNMVRFQDGVPSQVWYSQHGFGEAFTYEALEKQGVRPVAYSGNGSHANYATSGTHDHTIPNVNLPNVGLLTDYTDKGTLWDPLQNAYFYSFDPSANKYTAYDPSYPTAWLQFIGQWGDQQYPDSDPRQHKILGISATARFVGGPTGPQDKQLNRADVCPVANNYICVVRTSLTA